LNKDSPLTSTDSHTPDTPPVIDAATLECADVLIRLALDEDLQDRGDVTSLATVPEDAHATVNIVCREPGRLCGGVLIDRVYSALCQRSDDNAAVDLQVKLPDGAQLEKGSVVASVSGPVRLLLTGERTVLNFLIHLSGIASLTARFVDRATGSDAVILDTRKTLPGYRLLHKYAVRCGGGTNHRMGLFDGMLIKDNHLAARGGSSVADAVAAARTYLNDNALDIPVEVEVDTLDQLKDALAQHPEIVLLDNMTPAQLQQAVSSRNDLSPKTLLEASGGVNLETIGCIAGTGVDRISIGALTHSATALDLGYDWFIHNDR
jgi:nicotinate-nucleotide pyrophosphorylase (carboxylating)